MTQAEGGAAEEGSSGGGGDAMQSGGGGDGGDDNSQLCGSGCGKAATMACPTCMKLEVRPLVRFCTQECFQSFWPQHKGIHKEWKAKKAAEQAAAQPPAWARSYDFTGTLRPGAYAARRKVRPS